MNTLTVGLLILLKFLASDLLQGSMYHHFLSQGPTWDGRSGVHVHMTNTRITDPEILERR